MHKILGFIVVLMHASLFCMERVAKENESSREEMLPSLVRFKRARSKDSSSEEKQSGVEERPVADEAQKAPQSEVKLPQAVTPLIQRFVTEILAESDPQKRQARICSITKLLKPESRKEIFLLLFGKFQDAHKRRKLLEAQVSELEATLKNEESTTASLHTEYNELKEAVGVLTTDIKNEEVPSTVALYKEMDALRTENMRLELLVKAATQGSRNVALAKSAGTRLMAVDDRLATLTDNLRKELGLDTKKENK